jgi:hypothetical protein
MDDGLNLVSIIGAACVAALGVWIVGAQEAPWWGLALTAVGVAAAAARITVAVDNAKDRRDIARWHQVQADRTAAQAAYLARTRPAADEEDGRVTR